MATTLGYMLACIICLGGALGCVIMMQEIMVYVMLTVAGTMFLLAVRAEIQGHKAGKHLNRPKMPKICLVYGSLGFAFFSIAFLVFLWGNLTRSPCYLTIALVMWYMDLLHQKEAEDQEISHP